MIILAFILLVVSCAGLLCGHAVLAADGGGGSE